VSGPIRSGATAHGAWQPAMHDRTKGWLGLSLAARSDRETARGAVRRGDALAGSSVVADQRQGATIELAGASGRAPSKAVGGGAHPSGGATWRWWRMLRAAAFVGGEGAPVAGSGGGMTLQCRCGRRKVRAASNGDNSGGWKGLTVKRRRGGTRTKTREEEGGLRLWEPAKQTCRRWRRRGARAWAWTWSGVRRRRLLQFDGREGRAEREMGGGSARVCHAEEGERKKEGGGGAGAAAGPWGWNGSGRRGRR
jgi:hypothetical protein